MKLLPIIDDTPKPHDYPRRLWWYRVTNRRNTSVAFVWARSSGAARYAIAKRDYPNNAIWYSGDYRARRV